MQNRITRARSLDLAHRLSYQARPVTTETDHPCRDTSDPRGDRDGRLVILLLATRGGGRTTHPSLTAQRSRFDV